MSDYIEVTVRVPACLRVEDAYGAKRLLGPGRYGLLYDDNNAESWTCDLGRQIAAAVEARKPKPPLFQVGDVVEWMSRDGNPRAGVITGIGKTKEGLPEYWVNGGWQIVNEGEFKLVRRAEK